MHNWRQLVRGRLRGVNLEGAREAQVVDEIAQYLEDAYDECRARGVPADEALQRALSELADTRGLVRQLRKQEPAWQDPPPILSRHRGGMSMFTLLYDFKMASRSLRNRPDFGLMVIGMLALGIAANAAIFSIVNGFFLRPLPFHDPGRLVDLDEIAPKWNLQFVGISNADSFGWRAAPAFEGMAFYRTSDVTLTGAESARRVRAAQVTHDLLALLGLHPALGRGFSSDEDKPGGTPVAMISHGFWRRVYGGDPGVLGRTIQLSNNPFTVIGVLPPEAVIPDRADVWRPLQLDPNQINGWYLHGIGRLNRGISINQARSDLLRVHALMPASDGNHAAATSPRVDPFGEAFLGDYRPVANVLISAVAVVLLIACVNVAALMMVRGAARAREMAIRKAIGASRIRLVQQLIAENVLLAAAGGLAGVLIGRLALRGLIALMPEGLPAFIVFDFDFRFALFSVAVTGAAAVLSGFVPALQTAGADSAANLQETASRTTLSRGRRYMLNALVAGEVALALILLVGAGLLVRAFQKVMRVDPGFRAENVLTYNVVLPDKQYPKSDQRVAFYQNLLDQTGALPGVKFAAAATAPPLSGHWGDFYTGTKEPERSAKTKRLPSC
jgi:putative ABC transport system permease protein